MRRHPLGRQGAAARRKRGVGLDQLLVEREEGHLVRPERRHWRVLRHGRRLHRDRQADRTESSLEHHGTSIVLAGEDRTRLQRAAVLISLNSKHNRYGSKTRNRERNQPALIISGQVFH